MPPGFDWGISTNLDKVTLHWPAPTAIRSGEDLTLGYYDRLVLPLTAQPEDPSKPLILKADISLGLCENICVPVRVSLTAPAPGPKPSARIEAALANVPVPVSGQEPCDLRQISDGMQLSVLLSQPEVQLAAMEVMGRPDIWVSTPVLKPEGGATRATADFIDASGAPFDLDVSQLRVTLIGPDGATEMRGCALRG